MPQNILITKRENTNADNSMVPMINVVFLLLIFFMVAGTIRQIHSQDVEVPESNSDKSLLVGAIDVTITQEQEVRLNGESINTESLGSAINALMQQEPTSTVSLRADKHLHAEHLDTILNTLRNQGVQLITLYSQSVGNQ